MIRRKMLLPLVTPAEHGTVLAALRAYAELLEQSDEAMPDRLQSIATDGGRLRALSVRQISVLCERLNQEATPLP